MRYASILILLVLVGCADSHESYEERLDYLENRTTLDFADGIHIQWRKMECQEGFGPLKIHLQPSPVYDYETVEIECGKIIAADDEFDARVAAKAQELVATQQAMSKKLAEEE